jgi:hypothetical protein
MLATPPSAADPYAGWLPGPHSAIPLLPRGTALFESIPAPALVIDALSPAVGDGLLLIRRPGALGVILVRDGDLFEEYAFEGEERVDGGEALREIARWQDATVSAHRFDPVVVAVAPVLLRGTRCYEDLRLEWTDWGGLLSDLQSRDGLFAVELDTPLGRGVTLIVDGRQVATYTEGHPELGDEKLLDALAATRRGTIWVRREPGRGVLAEPASPTEAGIVDGDYTDEAAAPEAAPAPQAEPAAYFEPATYSEPAAYPEREVEPEPGAEPEPNEWSTPPPWRAEGVSEFTPPSYPPLSSSMASEDPFAGLGSDIETASPPAPRWADVELDAYPVSPHNGYPQGPSVPVAPIATALKQVARLRLQRSSPRVEAMVDEAAARDLGLDTLLDEIRGLVIRGVMQSTLDQVVDEMAAVASPHLG